MKYSVIKILYKANYLLLLFVYNTCLLISKLPFAPNFFIGTVVARRYGQGVRARDSQDYDRAFRLLKDFESLDFDSSYLSSSHYILGVLYFLGLGTEQDQERGMTLIKRAAENGDSNAVKYLKKLNDASIKEK